MSWVWAVGRMCGVSTGAGVRPALALLTLSLISVLSRHWGGYQVPGAFSWLAGPVAIIVLVILAILETALDKAPSLYRLQQRLAVPWHLAAGAIAGAAVMGHGWLGLVIGLPAGAALAWLGQALKSDWRPRSTSSTVTVPLLSLVEDLAVFIGVVLSTLLPPIGYALFGWEVWLFRQMRGRRRAKYDDLRALSDRRSAGTEERDT